MGCYDTEFDMSPEEIYGLSGVPRCCRTKWSAAAEREFKMYGEWSDPDDEEPEEDWDEDFDDDEDEDWDFDDEPEEEGDEC